MLEFIHKLMQAQNQEKQQIAENSRKDETPN